MFKFRSNSGQKRSPEPEPEQKCCSGTGTGTGIPVDLWSDGVQIHKFILQFLRYKEQPGIWEKCCIILKNKMQNSK